MFGQSRVFSGELPHHGNFARIPACMNDSQPSGLPPERKRDEPGDELFVEERTFPGRSKERLVLNSVLGEMRPEVPG